ncbi:MAG: CBS domain-containing protein [Pseudomonadales bacterium]|nr:CBS domain-containing protein [Pseudomonadales bacterium]
MTILKLHGLDRADHLVTPIEQGTVKPGSPALSIVTDFRLHEPIAFSGSMRAADALRLMAQTHARLRLVVDERGEFLGVVTDRDLCESRLLKRVAAGERRDQILVRDLMCHRRDLDAFEYRELADASVRDVLDALHDSGCRHCLVVESDTHSIRGLIAASDVARRLRMGVEFDSRPTFCEIFAALHHVAAS